MSDIFDTRPTTVAPPASIPEAGHLAPGGTHLWQCIRCGSNDLGSAYLIDYSDRFRQLQLVPRVLKLPRIARMLRPFRRMVNVSAQVCRHCGAVMLEVDPEDFVELETRYRRR